VAGRTRVAQRSFFLSSISMSGHYQPREMNGYGSSSFPQSSGGYQPRSSFSTSQNGSSNGYKPRQMNIGKQCSFKLLKNFYIEDEIIARANSEQVADFRLRNNNIMVLCDDPSIHIPSPIINFKQAFKCDPQILTAIESQNFTQPSPIQCQVWPILLSGHDCISISQTGSGKTLGFLLPGFVHSHMQTDPVLKDNRKPSILVICPTRELAQQTHNEVKKYAYRDFKTVCVYGGADKRNQISQLRYGAKVIVGTPGRLNDLINSGDLDVSCVTYSVLDEADRMLDMGFEPQIRSILDHLPRDRQNCMTSATWPKEAKELAQQYLNTPIQINIGKIDLHAAETITQIIELDCSDKYSKEEHLLNFLRRDDMRGAKTLVFVNTKVSATDMCRRLQQSGINADTIHGNLDQYRREQALNQFRNNHCNILTATDVAARGLDLPDIDFVINLDMANNIDEYVHRIGRTGRAGKSGTAITYFTPQDGSMAKKLIKVLTEANQKIDPRLFQYQTMAPSKGGSSYGRNSYRSGGSRNDGGYQRFGDRSGGDRFGSGGGFNNGFKREKSDFGYNQRY